MPVLHAKERITERAEFSRQHECLNASHVALEGEGLQVEHQFNVLHPIFRNAARRFRRFKTMFGALLLGLDNLSLDFTNVFEVLIELRRIFLPQTLGEALDALGNGVQDARVLIQLKGSLFISCSITAEHPLKHNARIQFHRQRLSRRTPGKSAHIGA